MTEKDYTPGGCTALLDAIGDTVHHIEQNAPVLSKELRRAGGYAYSGRWQKTEGK